MGGSTSSGITSVYFATLVRGQGHPAWTGRMPAREGTGEREEFLPPGKLHLTPALERCWSSLRHPHFATGEAVVGEPPLILRLKKGKYKRLKERENT